MPGVISYRLFSSTEGGEKTGDGEDAGDAEGDEKEGDEVEVEGEEGETEGEVAEEEIDLHSLSADEKWQHILEDDPSRKKWTVSGNEVDGEKIDKLYELWRADPVRFSYEALGARYGLKKPVVRAMMLLKENQAGTVRNARQFDVLVEERIREAADKAHEKKMRAETAKAAGKPEEVDQEELDVEEAAENLVFWELESAKQDALLKDPEGGTLRADILADEEDEDEMVKRADRAEKRRQRRMEYFLDRTRRIPQVPEPPIQYEDLPSLSGAPLINPKWKYVFVDISKTRDERKLENLLVRDPNGKLRTATANEERQWRYPMQFD